MGDKDELKDYFEDKFDRLDDKLEKQIKRSNQTINIFLIFFIFVIGGSFAFTSRVNTDLQETKQKLENISDDLTDIDGALGARYPDSAVFGERHKREVRKRGYELDR